MSEFSHLTEMQANILSFARRMWPLGFTQSELAKATGIQGHIVGVRQLRKMRLLEDTKVRRPKGRKRRLCVVWRYKPVQLPLPFEGGSNAERKEKAT